MGKSKIIIILLMMLSIGIISLYTTYAYEEENAIETIIEESTADNNFQSELKESENKEVIIGPKEEKFYEMTLNQPYDENVKYGIFYKMVSPEQLASNVTITLADDSEDILENVIKPGETINVSIKIINDSEYTVTLILDAKGGFENRPIDEIDTDWILIK